MVDLQRALIALGRMAHLISRSAASLAAPRRYERTVNDYETALLIAYQSWLRSVLKALRGGRATQTALQEFANDLQARLARVGTEHLPYAVTAIGVADYVPSPDAWRMIADAIDAQNRDLATRLVPEVVDKLQRAVDEGADSIELNAVAESLIPRVAEYAGNLWVVIQRLVGDFAAQARERDDVIYPVRWVRVQDDHSCPSCRAFEGTYDSYEVMLRATNQCVPGYFVNSPYRSCWWNCRCWLELKIGGVWTRI